MAKETFYFTHDYNARNDDKILELRSIHGAEGYGIFWMIVETMAENSNGGVKATLIGGLSLGYGVAKDTLIAIFKCCLDIGLFYEKDGFYFSKRMLTHKELRTKLSESGKAGAEKRWGGYGEPNGKGKEIKKKEIKNDITHNSVSSNSNLFRQPNIPKFEEVHRVFVQNGGTEEMAKTFFNTNEGLGWYKNSSPITNFTNLVPSYISTWTKNEQKNGRESIKGVGKSLEFDRP